MTAETTTAADGAAILAKLTADGVTLLDRLDHWAEHRPDAVCIYDGEAGTEITYREFAAATDRMAGGFAALGLQKGDRVSVLTTNSVLAAQTIFSCWKAGAVYCPVNFSYRGRLLSYQLNDTRPQLIVSDPEHAGRIDEVWAEYEGADGTRLVVLGEEQAETAAASAPRIPWSAVTADRARPRISVGPGDPANIIYTSGTTGPAKGVLQPHLWVNQYTFGMRGNLDHEDVVYNDLPMYHVGGAFANFGKAIWAGCETAMWNRFSPSEFWDRIALRRATSAILLDVMVPWLMKAPPTEHDRDNTLCKVHMQPLPLHHTEVARRFGIDFVSAGFGQTESGAPLKLMLRECPPGTGTPERLRRGRRDEDILADCARRGTAVVDGETVTVKGAMGFPAEFCEAAVLDPDDRPCAPGEPGELAVRPLIPNLMMLEYLGRPEATEKAWRGGWFHTGDSAIQDEDGSFRFIDRLGDRIRVRGENLSSFQVEDLLNTHPDVQMSAVFAVPGAEGDEDDIVAYVVAAEGAALTEEVLRDHADATMPKFMRPRHVRIVDDIPRTPTNKIEKYKLRREFASADA
ncbi:class I adenylate-forming enzyme family protein [Brevibacterium album]|uniref:class I adenylate-forming enzyme family protein n=1 Tax=Brevibacterium album TaxID=417948 RepID=UPI00041AD05B|nr:AMP-binding protein [Brevibacterium album]